MWILGRWIQIREMASVSTTLKTDLQMDVHKWRTCALRQTKVGCETAFPRQACVAMASSPRGRECIHKYAVQQEQFNRIKQVVSRHFTAVLYHAKLGCFPRTHRLLLMCGSILCAAEIE